MFIAGIGKSTVSGTRSLRSMFPSSSGSFAGVKNGIHHASAVNELPLSERRSASTPSFELSLVIAAKLDMSLGQSTFVMSTPSALPHAAFCRPTRIPQNAPE